MRHTHSVKRVHDKSSKPNNLDVNINLTLLPTESKPTPNEINGLNLANYFPHQRSYNSVVYIHKKYLDDYKSPEIRKEKNKLKKEKKHKLVDKHQQFNCDKNTEVSTNNRTYKVNNNNCDHVLDQTIRFAKNLVPLVIPQSDDKLPVYYTIKTSRKHKMKERKPQETSFDNHGAEKGETKKVYETYRKVRKESYNVRESISQGSSNTLDDLNINQSLSCTFSEVSEKKYHKKDRSHHKKLNNGSKVVVSESFEALATENLGESKIKVHLMNEKDKHLLSDSIKAPILTALKECISDISNCNNASEISEVQKILKCNTTKLNTILEKISAIEKKLNSQPLRRHSETRVSENKSLPAVQKVQTILEAKASALEELEEDLIESKEDYSSEEELHQEMLYRRSKSVVTELVSEEKLEAKLPILGGGEVTGGLKDNSTGVKPDRPNRIPARFCWTDAAGK